MLPRGHCLGLNSGFSSWFCKLRQGTQPLCTSVSACAISPCRSIRAGPGSHIVNVDVKSHGVRVGGARALGWLGRPLVGITSPRHLCPLSQATPPTPPGSFVHENSWQEYWSGLPCPLQRIFLTQGLNPHLLHWPVDSLSLSHSGKLQFVM